MGILVDLAKFRRQREEKELEELRQKLAVAIERMGEPEVGPYYVEADDRAGLVDRVIEFVISQRGLDGYSAWTIDSSDL
jgi:hypothetical protein